MKHLTLVSRNPAPAQANAALGTILGLISAVVNVFATQVAAKEAAQQQQDPKPAVTVPPEG